MTDSKRGEEPPASAALEDPVFVARLREHMVKFARLQMGDQHLAEDAVQEALLAAYRHAGTFEGKAGIKSWVFAILRNKIVDVIRHNRRIVSETSLLIDQSGEGDERSQIFDERGMWHPERRPEDWPSPDAAFRDDEFWHVFEACVERLPSAQARVFMMREFVDLDTEEICTTLGVTVNNLNVLMHRARLRLRECLESGWFAAGESSC